MRSLFIILWILAMVVRVAADVVGFKGASTPAFWLGSAFLWVGLAKTLRGSALTRWGGAFLLTLVVTGLAYVVLMSVILVQA